MCMNTVKEKSAGKTAIQESAAAQSQRHYQIDDRDHDEDSIANTNTNTNNNNNNNNNNSNYSIIKQRGKRFVKSSHGCSPSNTYVHCNSLDSYIAYRAPLHDSKHVKKTLNLYLGLPINPRNISILRYICDLLCYLFSLVIEVYLIKAWDATPLKYRQYLSAEAWKLYFPIHRAVLSNRTAIHKDASYEYHAFSTLMYWIRLLPLSVRRVRFAMNTAAVVNGDNAYPYPVINMNKHDDADTDEHEDKYEGSTNNINRERKHTSSGPMHAMARKTEKVYYDGDLGEYGLLSKLQNQSAGDVPPVSGYYVTNVKRKSSNKVLLYLFGGAFIGGQCEADLPYATKMSQICDMDAFLPSYRLLPEHKFADSLEDVYRAYIYLVGVRGVQPQDIVLAGLSSGAGLLVRLLQRIQEATGSSTRAPTGTDDTSTSTSTFTSSCIMPSGAVLMCPLVDFTSGDNNDESMTQYACHDLIISEVS